MPVLDVQQIYIRAMGKAVRVTAIFTTDTEANAYMQDHPDEGVVAEVDGIVFIAATNDLGAGLASAPC